MSPEDTATAPETRPAARPARVRELVFCASQSQCTTARIIEKGTVFFCKEHYAEEAALLEKAGEGLAPGVAVIAKDRRNRGIVQSVSGTTAVVRFDRSGNPIDVEMSVAWLEKA